MGTTNPMILDGFMNVAAVGIVSMLTFDSESDDEACKAARGVANLLLDAEWMVLEVLSGVPGLRGVSNPKDAKGTNEEDNLDKGTLGSRCKKMSLDNAAP